MSSCPELRTGILALTIAGAFLGPLPVWGSESGRFEYGAPASPEQIAGWDIDVRPDGAGLPPGHGSVSQGEEIFQQQCAQCHGTFGEGAGRYPKLSGGEGTLKGDRPEPTVGSYWPYASTLWDYVNRAMPFQAPRSLSADEVYAVTAYVLNLNNIVGSDFVADRNSLPTVKMPNRDRFTWSDPRPDTAAKACMEHCRDPGDVKIVSTAEGSTLTPRTTGPLDEMEPQ